MSCKSTCRLCNRLIISQSVTFTDGTLIINIPAGSYNNGCKYCIIVAQAIPDTATVNAPVVITIGTGTEQYPLTNRCCVQMTARRIDTRTRYSTVVSTTPTGGGTFKILGNVCSCPANNLTSINGTAPAAPANFTDVTT